MSKGFQFPKNLLQVFVLLSVVLFAPLVWGQEYPSKPIELIANFPPGGAAPMIGAMAAEKAKKYLPMPVVMNYKPGAAGTIGAYYVAKATPDGYTFLVTSPGPILTAPLFQEVGYDPLEFEFVASVHRQPILLTVKADAPWKTLPDLISYAKNNPEVVTCGNGGTNSSQHLYAILFAKKAGIKITHVPFAGAAPNFAALAGGHISVAVRAPGESEALIDAKKLRDLTVLDKKRYKFYPNVPTCHEAGVLMEGSNWSAILAPKGTPKKIIALWENMIDKISQDPSFIEGVEKLKMNIEFRRGDIFKKDLVKEIQVFSDIANEMGIKRTK